MGYKKDQQRVFIPELVSYSIEEISGSMEL